MKLLEGLNKITCDRTEMIEAMKQSLIDRQINIEMREPMCDGSYYEKWEEKYDDITNIIDEIEELQDLDDAQEKVKKLDEIKMNIQIHQVIYGGLKRLTI